MSNSNVSEDDHYNFYPSGEGFFNGFSRFFCLWAVAGHHGMSPWQRFCVTLGQVVALLGAIGIFLIAGASFTLILIAIHLPVVVAAGLSFGLIAIPALIVNWRIGCFEIPQLYLNIFGARHGGISSYFTAIVDEKGQKTGEKMSWQKRALLLISGVFALASGLVYAGLAIGLFNVLIPFIGTGLGMTLFPLAVAAAIAVTLSISALTFDSFHKYLRQDWFTFDKIGEHISNYFNSTLKDELRKNLKGDDAEKKLTRSEIEKIEFQAKATKIVSVIFIVLIVAGLALTAFFAAQPGIASFLVFLGGHFLPAVTVHSVAIQALAWVIAGVAFAGNLPFYVRTGIVTAQQTLAFIFAENSNLKPDEVGFTLCRFVDALLNACIGAKPLIEALASGAGIQGGFAAFTVSASFGCATVSFGCSGGASGTPMGYEFEKEEGYVKLKGEDSKDLEKYDKDKDKKREENSNGTRDPKDSKDSKESGPGHDPSPSPPAYVSLSAESGGNVEDDAAIQNEPKDQIKITAPVYLNPHTAVSALHSDLYSNGATSEIINNPPKVETYNPKNLLDTISGQPSDLSFTPRWKNNCQHPLMKQPRETAINSSQPSQPSAAA